MTLIHLIHWPTYSNNLSLKKGFLSKSSKCLEMVEIKLFNVNFRNKIVEMKQTLQKLENISQANISSKTTIDKKSKKFIFNFFVSKFLYKMEQKI